MNEVVITTNGTLWVLVALVAIVTTIIAFVGFVPWAHKKGYQEGHQAGRQVTFIEELKKARRTYDEQRELYNQFHSTKPRQAVPPSIDLDL